MQRLAKLMVDQDLIVLVAALYAHPDLLRAAKHHGEQTERTCPTCQRGELVHVTYTFGDDLGYLTGRVRASRELPELAREFGHFRVYIVEVCQRCSWNHLHLSYVLGDGTPKTGAHGKPVLFLHPKDFCGTLIELEQA